MQNSKIIWLTGMSGAGKSFYANYLTKRLDESNKTVKILDGDNVRDSYDVPLGFSHDDICKNNLFIADICQKEYQKYDVTIVSVISPYEKIRNSIKKIFQDDIFFIYVKSDIAALKERDTKNLYFKADNNEIKNLIGYSKISKYEEPSDPDITLYTSSQNKPQQNYEILNNFISKNLC